MLPVIFRAGDTDILIVLIYGPPGRMGTFIDDLIEESHSLPVHH